MEEKEFERNELTQKEVEEEVKADMYYGKNYGDVGRIDRAEQKKSMVEDIIEKERLPKLSLKEELPGGMVYSYSWDEYPAISAREFEDTTVVKSEAISSEVGSGYYNYIQTISNVDKEGRVIYKAVPMQKYDSNNAAEHLSDALNSLVESSIVSDTVTLSASELPPPSYQIPPVHWGTEMPDTILESFPPTFYSTKRKPINVWKEKVSREKLYNIGVGYTITDEHLTKCEYYNYGSSPIIVRDYEKFQNTIIELFGVVSEPTLIPAFILFQFELDPSHYNLEYTIPRRSEGEDDEYTWDKPFVSKKWREENYHHVEGTGYSCILWLIQNNYIPCNFTTHGDEEQTESLMYSTLIDWIRKNGYSNNPCKYK